MRHTNKHLGTCALNLGAITLLAVAAFAQGQNAGDGPPVLANKIAVASGAPARLSVTSGAFTSGDTLSDK